MQLDADWAGLTFRSARPQVLAVLLRELGSLERAEEAFQEACLKALQAWATNGPPRNAAGWLTVVGRNAGIDQVRRNTRERALPETISSPIEVDEEDIDTATYGDDLLRLLFICCHRDLKAHQQIALALRIVSGLTVAEVAAAFLLGEKAMAQRLTRAKRVVRQADTAFETPSPLVRTERLSTVSTMIYLMFNQGYAASAQESTRTQALGAEAVRLGRLLLDLYPDEPELLGLVGLMLLQEARSSARFDEDGGSILLKDQNRTLWDRRMIAEGTALTDRAFRMRRPGRFQLQAGIAALHARAMRFEDTDWVQIEQLYRALTEAEPTPVVALNHAVAVSQVYGASAALALVEPLAGALDDYFYFHAVRGHLLEMLARPAEALAAYGSSLRLATSIAEAAQVRAFIDRLQQR
ncbi:RNA polymerase, sigma subunit, ECF family [Sphingomonas gellani]|uniref:RNA polymerase, sigma subunit, ECF family n=1 Tax=Sphingomonas gellani TaxID=1166340 RepID=A0A1H8IHA6_9SPHN|nr:sigma-70 family RNA polymerase sigma factor [Sphingomonas gellani]SEN68053.1 RNA polymerase, sigma subunit, ECF family [Sphingomonas gellani]